MRGRQVRDVEVVTERSAIGRGIIHNRELKVLALSQRRSNRGRDQVPLRIVFFPQLAFWISARRVKITECDPTKGTSFPHPLEHFLCEELRFSIRVNRCPRVILGYRDLLRHAIGPPYESKHEPRHSPAT